MNKEQKNKTETQGTQEWYIVNAYSGHEKRVANQIQQRAKANNLEDLITEVLVPIQNKIVVSEGKKRTVEEKIFPGYVLVKMIMNDQTWQIIRNTEGVTGFVGTERKPTPLNPEEVKSILAYMKVEQPSYQASFAVGDAVKVMDGPFKDFVGSISEINEDKGQVKVLLSVFGRETPVILDFLQITRL
ncbi:MAG TPA: transcription termination/antitermination protein NusG [Candidatus Dojkabacteria bacterium]|jgi:transcriptional antiterminator NusG|nr:transcription termination/antitermination protein NusG [Candidatus Dojkabacteria bacterium]